jgi:hypothetical protein
MTCSTSAQELDWVDQPHASYTASPRSAPPLPLHFSTFPMPALWQSTWQELTGDHTAANSSNASASIGPARAASTYSLHYSSQHTTPASVDSPRIEPPTF